MRILLILFISVTGLGLSACVSLHHDADSDETETSVNDYYQDKTSKEESDARDELGYGSRPLSEAEAAALDERLHLQRLEAQLESKRDRQQYYASKGLMRDDTERIHFLRLPSYESKQRYLENRGLLKEPDTFSEPVAKAIDAQDIMKGMTKKAVRESWGDPDLVEVAGDPMYGYERWNYHRFVPGSDGFQKELRIVYFESGRVVGWETPK